MSAAEYRVTGPPGTGKTEWIKRQVEGWAHQYEPEDFALTSLTRSAASVLSGRVPVPHENTATLHAFAYRALGTPPIAEVGELRTEWNGEDIPDSWKIGTTRPPADLEDAVIEADHGGEMLATYSLGRSLLEGPGQIHYELSRHFRERWEAFKQERGAIDFSDMIDLAFAEVDRHPANPAVLIADEAQDFVPSQWRLLRKWAAAPEIERFVVAGDPAQVLYGFAGARPDEFMSELPAGQERMLATSYRLPQTVHRAAERFLATHSGTISEGRNYKPQNRVGQVRLTEPGVSWRRPSGIIRDALGQVAQGRTVMILATCTYMLQPTVAALRDRGVPFWNPYRRANGAWNPLGTDRDNVVRTIDRVLAFLRPDAATWGHDARLNTSEESLQWIQMVRASIFAKRGTKKALLAGSLKLPLDEDGLTFPSYWMDLIPGEVMGHLCDQDTGWLVEHVLKPYDRVTSYAHQIREHQGGAALREDPKVIVGTVHSVKGGEADVVYIYPDVSLAAWHEMKGSQEGRDAAVRVGYVALTRAREEVVIAAPTSDRAPIALELRQYAA